MLIHRFCDNVCNFHFLCKLLLWLLLRVTCVLSTRVLFLAMADAGKTLSSKEWQKKIDAKDERIKRLSAILRQTRSEKAALVSKRRAAEKREGRTKVEGERRGRGEKYPGHCLACVYRILGKPGGKAHNRSRCAFTKNTPKTAFKP